MIKTYHCSSCRLMARSGEEHSIDEDGRSCWRFYYVCRACGTCHLVIKDNVTSPVITAQPGPTIIKDGANLTSCLDHEWEKDLWKGDQKAESELSILTDGICCHCKEQGMLSSNTEGLLEKCPGCQQDTFALTKQVQES